MREHGPLIWLPTVAGTASHLPSSLPRYSTVALTAPFCLISGSMTSPMSTIWSEYRDGSHWASARTSWPALACDSAAPVSKSLLPCDVMKSIVTSTFSFSAHALTAFSVALFAVGTQWSQKPTESLPAAWAPRTKGAAIMAVDKAAVLATKPRRLTLREAICCLLCGDPHSGSWRSRYAWRLAQAMKFSHPAFSVGYDLRASGGNSDATADRRCPCMGRHGCSPLPRQGSDRWRAHCRRGTAVGVHRGRWRRAHRRQGQVPDAGHGRGPLAPVVRRRHARHGAG